MNFKYKYTLGQEYYISDGWTNIQKVKLIGVKFINNKIFYLSNCYPNANTSFEETLVSVNLNEAKKKSLNLIDQTFKEIKNEISNITENDLEKKEK